MSFQFGDVEKVGRQYFYRVPESLREAAAQMILPYGIRYHRMGSKLGPFTTELNLWEFVRGLNRLASQMEQSPKRPRFPSSRPLILRRTNLAR